MNPLDIAAQLAPGLDWCEAFTDDLDPMPYALAALPLDHTDTPRVGALSLMADRGMWAAALTVQRDYEPQKGAEVAHIAIQGGGDPFSVWQSLTELCHGIGCAPDIIDLIGSAGGGANAGPGSGAVDLRVLATSRNMADEDPKG